MGFELIQSTVYHDKNGNVVAPKAFYSPDSISQDEIDKTQARVNAQILSEPTLGGTWDTTVTSVVVDGPLKDLENGSKYKPSLLAYPRDLGSLAKGHMIQFDIRDVDPAKINLSNLPTAAENFYNTTTDVAKTTDYTSGASYELAATRLTGAVKTFGQESGLTAAAGSVVEKLTTGDAFKGNQLNFSSPLTKDVIDSIRLYMPDTMNFSYNAQYDKLSLAEAINSVPLVAKVSNAITSVLNNSAVKLASQKIGYVFNPQQQMLFEGIDFREFELEFTFTPTSPEEAAMINTIIKKLRRAAAPTINTAAGGFFFTPPSVFNISFLFNGQINTNIQQARPCVLQAITTNYAPNGWAALSDGAPVQTVVSLSFKEIELVDRQSIEDEK